MKTIAICNPCMKDIFRDNSYSEYILDGDNLYISILDIPRQDYIEYFNEYSVLVEVKAFSCNLRDRALVHIFAANLS
jgi:hypothetical protein